MKKLTKAQILKMHSDLIAESGGLDGLRDENLFDSAINAPFQTFYGTDLYPTILQKAARLCYGLVSNHPFIDGNKRIATHCMLVFLGLNQLFLDYEDNELIEIILALADGSLNSDSMISWLQNHISDN